MNKNIIFLAVAALAAFVMFKVMKGEDAVTLPTMPTPPAEVSSCAKATEDKTEDKQPVLIEAAPALDQTPAPEQQAPVVDLTQTSTEANPQEPQMTQEEFEKLITELVKAAEEEKKKKDAASAQPVAPVPTETTPGSAA